MRTIFTVIAFIFVATLFTPSSRAAECAEKLTPKSDIGALFTCIREMNTEIEKLAERASNLVSVPKEAILVIDHPKGCPAGWTSFAPAHGRFIIGAGPPELTRALRALSERFYLEKGGEESVALTVEQMPQHNHPLSVESGPTNDFLGGSTADFGIDEEFKRSNRQENDVIGAMGGSQPHNNMPPYIALYFCKKD